MVLDAKALTWASEHDIDTAKLKKAKVPIYGKWYFPELPPGVPLINLQTGERQTFEQRMIAGEVIWVAEADLQRAGLLPGGGAEPTEPPPEPVPTPEATAPDVSVAEVTEPLLAMARPPRYPAATETALARTDENEAALALPETVEAASIHLPSPSVAPFVFGVGFCLALLGVITNPLIVAAGLLWLLVGAVAWIRIGLLEQQRAHADEEPVGE
jgi:hypothetical protein